MSEYRSGFVTFVGRPNAGKSTLLNKILGHKVSIVSDKPQTTRTQVRGMLNSPDVQLVFVDTPGIHKPRSALGTSLNATAQKATAHVDVVCLVLDATAPYGRGDAFIAQSLPADSIVIVTKADMASPEQILKQLTATSELSVESWFPVSGKTGEGTDELVREQLLAVTREELPHSIATRVTEWDWPRIRVEIIVERDSQKGIVIGKKGENLKKAGIAVRAQLPDEVFIELFVKVEKNWQHQAHSVEKLGY
jgi:GTP-binding protein Era